MTIALGIILTALILGLAYLWLRRFEFMRGQRFFEKERAFIDYAAEDVWAALVLGGIPVAWRKYAAALAHEVTHVVVQTAVEGVRAVERPLARLSYKLRVSAPRSTGAPVSEFLKTLSPERK